MSFRSFGAAAFSPSPGLPAPLLFGHATQAGELAAAHETVATDPAITFAPAPAIQLSHLLPDSSFHRNSREKPRKPVTFPFVIISGAVRVSESLQT